MGGERAGTRGRPFTDVGEWGRTIGRKIGRSARRRGADFVMGFQTGFMGRPWRGGAGFMGERHQN